MPTVYRVEHPSNGLGPYKYRVNKPPAIQKMVDHHCNSFSHPAPHCDFRHMMSPKDVCGFVSLDSLRKWFRGYLGALDREGFFVAVYEPRKVLAGSPLGGTGQVVFRKPRKGLADRAGLLGAKKKNKSGPKKSP